MRPRFAVVWTEQARDDLGRLLDHLLERAESVEDLAAATEVIDGLEEAAKLALSVNPLLYRRAEGSLFFRELIVPGGATGYVVLYDILDSQRVSVLALRHQREDDYH